MKVIDAFIWSGAAREYGMLDLRLRTLSKAVDAHVAVTATLTHQGEPVPEHGFPMIPDRGDGFVIERVSFYRVEVDPLPDGDRGGVGSPHNFRIENQHRAGVTAALDWAATPPLTLTADDTWSTIGPDDVILVSDLDEIPDPATLDRIVELVDLHGVVGVPMRMHGFALDYLHPATPWVGTTAARRRDLDPQAHRDRRFALPRAGSGWHFSWFGTDAERAEKLDSFAHAELRGKLDVAAAYEQGYHANGEQLRRLSVDEMAALRWPEPMVDGSFKPPASWYAPSQDAQSQSSDDLVIVARDGDVIPGATPDDDPLLLRLVAGSRDGQ